MNKNIFYLIKILTATFFITFFPPFGKAYYNTSLQNVLIKKNIIYKENKENTINKEFIKYLKKIEKNDNAITLTFIGLEINNKYYLNIFSDKEKRILINKIKNKLQLLKLKLINQKIILKKYGEENF